MFSKAKSKSESEWHKTVAEFARETSFLIDKFGGYCTDPLVFHLDHVLGAQAKRKTPFVSEKVGEWVVIPVPVELHDVHSNNSLQLTKYKNRFENVFGTRISIWLELIEKMVDNGYKLPFSDEVIEAVIRG